jgi:AraC family transcriptional regulator
VHFELITLLEKKLIGKRLTMSLSQNKTGQLWGSFMPRRKEIKNAASKDLYSMQIYSPTHFQNFSPDNEFEKWAAVEVSSFDSIPPDMESYTLVGGLYAVFLHKGSSTDTRTFQYIFGTWLPTSDFVLDNRPHFELLGEKYKNNDPTSEEEIWIPVKKK